MSKWSAMLKRVKAQTPSRPIRQPVTNISTPGGPQPDQRIVPNQTNIQRQQGIVNNPRGDVNFTKQPMAQALPAPIAAQPAPSVPQPLMQAQPAPIVAPQPTSWQQDPSRNPRGDVKFEKNIPGMPGIMPSNPYLQNMGQAFPNYQQYTGGFGNLFANLAQQLGLNLAPQAPQAQTPGIAPRNTGFYGGMPDMFMGGGGYYGGGPRVY